MIEIPRCVARQFRAMLRRTVMAQESRVPWPQLVCQADAGGLVLQAAYGEMAVRYHLPGSRTPDTIAFCSAVLAEFEGSTDRPVVLEQMAPGRGRAHWDDGGVPRVTDFEVTPAAELPAFPAVPRKSVSMPPDFLRALDEAAKTTAKEAVRFAINRVQFRGAKGAIVGTDGRQLLAQAGYPFPWTEDLLVPRLAVFGGRASFEGDVRVGRTETHVAVLAGHWTFLLDIDKTSRFPDAASVIPRPAAVRSRLRLDREDAAFLAATLPKLPGKDDDHAPVTLDLGEQVAVRARASGKGPVTEVVLTRSRATDAPVRVSLDRHNLLRAAKLGFAEIGVVSAEQPLVCRDDQRVYVFMPLEKGSVIPPGPDMLTITSAGEPVAAPPPPPERRDQPMPVPAPNGNHPESRPSAPAAERPVGLDDLLTEVDSLRTLLGEAMTRTARLFAALKQQRRQARVVRAAMASLRQLQLEP